MSCQWSVFWCHLLITGQRFVCDLWSMSVWGTYVRRLNFVFDVLKIKQRWSKDSFFIEGYSFKSIRHTTHVAANVSDEITFRKLDQPLNIPVHEQYESVAHERTNIGFEICMRKLHKEKQRLVSTSVRRIYMYTWKNRNWFWCLYEGSTHERIYIGFDVCMKDVHVHLKEQTLVLMSVWRTYTWKNWPIGFDVCMKVMHMKEQTLVSMSVWENYTRNNRHWVRRL